MKAAKERERINYFTKLRNQRNGEILENQKTLQRMRFTQMAQIKKERESIERKKKEEMLLHIQANEAKKREIKNFEERQQIKKREFFEARIRNFRQGYEMRIQKEEELKRKRERQISEMELVEKELLQKLAQTQAEQKSVLQELEMTVSQPPKELMQKLAMYAPQRAVLPSKVLPPVRKSGLSKSFAMSRNLSFDNGFPNIASPQRSLYFDLTENGLGSTNHSMIQSNTSLKTMLETKNNQKVDWSYWKNKAVPRDAPTDYEEIGEELTKEKEE